LISNADGPDCSHEVELDATLDRYQAVIRQAKDDKTRVRRAQKQVQGAARCRLGYHAKIERRARRELIAFRARSG
jgi:hypothetical protein